MNYREEQQKEIDTIKKRTFTLKLSDADVQSIWEKSGSVGLSVSNLLENFVGDLVNGTYSNGADERDLANQWFDRCGFGMFPEKTFLSFLINRGDIEGFLELYHDMETSENIIAVLKENIKTGIMKSSNGSTYTWEDLVTCTAEGDKPAYSNREDWEKEQLEDLEQTKEIVTDCQDQIKDYWNDFLQFANGETGTMEEEIEKVLNWYKERKNMIEE